MTTFSKAQRATRNRSPRGALKLSVGHKQITPSITIDYATMTDKQWAVSLLPGERFGFQLHEFPLDITKPLGIVVVFRDKDGRPVPNVDEKPETTDSKEPSHTADSEEEDTGMSVVDGDYVTEMLKSYIGDGELTLIDTSTPKNVYVIDAPINPGVLG